MVQTFRSCPGSLWNISHQRTWHGVTRSKGDSSETRAGWKTTLLLFAGYWILVWSRPKKSEQLQACSWMRVMGFLVSSGFDLSKLLWSIVEHSLWSVYIAMWVMDVNWVMCFCCQLRLMMTQYILMYFPVHWSHWSRWNQYQCLVIAVGICYAQCQVSWCLWFPGGYLSNWLKKFCQFYWLMVDGQCYLFMHVNHCKYKMCKYVHFYKVTCL